MDSPKADEPITFSHFNIKAIPTRVRSTFFGKVRAFNTFTKWEWIYLAISLLGLAASFGLSIQRVFTLGTDTSDFTFAILLLLTIVFCCYYVIHAVLTERGDELMIFVISNIIVLVYCVMNYILQERSMIKLVRLIIVCVLSPYLIGNGIWQSVIYCRSNNLIFNTVGGSSSLQKACRVFYLCSSLLKFDLQLQLSMLILVMGSNANKMNLEQQVILGSGVPISIIIIIIGFFGLKKESPTIMTLFYMLGLLEPVYIGYKFYYAATHEQEVATYESTFACGCFALIVWVCLMVATGYFATYQFGKGLKEIMFEDSGRTQAEVPSTSSQSVAQ